VSGTDSGPQVIYRADKNRPARSGASVLASAWRYLGWLGYVLTFVGTLDVALKWYPAALKSTEWEFATTSMSIASLPLLSIGTVVLLISFLARGLRPGVGAMAILFGALALFVVVVLVLFGLDVPIALRAVTAPGPRTEILKNIGRTVLMGVAFLALFVAGAAVSVRYLLKG
jgi:hypothetical protein